MPFSVETYHLAELARHKLLLQASQADHDLRQLVLHANLLDGLLLELNLAELERAKEDQQSTERTSSKPRRRAKASGISPAVALQHARLHGTDQPVIFMSEMGEDAVEDEESSPPMLAHDSGSESDSGSDYSDSDQEDISSALTSPTTSISEEIEINSGKEENLQLHRTSSSKWRGTPWVR